MPYSAETGYFRTQKSCFSVNVGNIDINMLYAVYLAWHICFGGIWALQHKKTLSHIFRRKLKEFMIGHNYADRSCLNNSLRYIKNAHFKKFGLKTSRTIFLFLHIWRHLLLLKSNRLRVPPRAAINSVTIQKIHSTSQSSFGLNENWEKTEQNEK